MQRVFQPTMMLSTTAAIALLVTGCGESKVSQCNKIVKVANKAATIGQEFGKNPKPQQGSKSLTEVAGKIDGVANEMKAVEVKDEKLQGYQGRFLTLYQDTSKGLRDAASALDKKNFPAANNFLASLKKTTSQESAIVQEINSYCSGK
ncbi:hypothetical protein I8752_21940 [Nostocaceae cyanobacterium CENA369]|uniref:Uncharacterized protein n=1 Tax=Dendronalium phyllosphericum CENA369 TaxID=1725256 RepID=A0A8J7I661_9NOST|nr:hypothetical protein [Dendronalium phyllosphericum]MBH8575620.1 hypothetical protein [Dendronalium phyllosphericum CENA369]